MSNDNRLISQEELQNLFETIKETDASGGEWWNSRRLARLIDYQNLGNFEWLMIRCSHSCIRTIRPSIGHHAYIL